MVKYFLIIVERYARFLSCRNDFQYNDNYNSCFNVFAADILLDKNDNIYILEVNTSPYLTPESYDNTYSNKRIISELVKAVIEEKPSMFKEVFNQDRPTFDYQYSIKGIRRHYKYDKDAGYEEILQALMMRDNFSRRQYFQRKIIDLFFAYRLRLEKYSHMDGEEVGEEVGEELNLGEENDDFFTTQQKQETDTDSDTMSDSGSEAESIDYNTKGLIYTDRRKQRAEQSRMFNRIFNSVGLYGDKIKLYDFMVSDRSGVKDQVSQYFPKTYTDVTRSNMDEIPFGGDRRWIAKPAKGSKGKGIKVIKTKQGLLNAFDQYGKKDKWLVSELIEPDLIKLPSKPDSGGRKYHFRSYVLAYKDNQERLQGFVYKDAICYMAYSPYNKDKFTEDVMLTNLDASRRTAAARGESTKDLDKIYTCNFFDHYDGDVADVRRQMNELAELTIKGYKNQIRCRNKFETYYGCFHLLAYDLMISDDGKLYILEVNTAPGLKGPRGTWGSEKLTEFFDDIFKLTIDKKTNAYKQPRADSDQTEFTKVYDSDVVQSGGNLIKQKYLKYKSKYLSLR